MGLVAPTTTAAPSTVAIVIPSLRLGGAERVALWLASSLQRYGHRVLLVTQLPPETDAYPIPTGVNRHVLGSQAQWRGLHRPARTIAHAAAALRLRRLLQAEHVHVVVAWMPLASVLSVLACAGLPHRLVIAERSTPWRAQLPLLLSAARRLLYRFSDAQVAQTQPVAHWLQQQAGCRQPAVIPNAVQFPLPRLDPQRCPTRCIRSDRKLLLAAGTKPLTKGFDLLLTAFTAIATCHPSWDLAIVGPDPHTTTTDLTVAELRKHIDSAGLGGRVHLPGPVGNIGDWYARADLFVLSSRFEGIPNVLLEALAHGCACLSTDCPTGPRDLIEHGINGLLVPANSASALAAGLDQLMANPSQRAALAARALEVRSRFAAEPILRRWNAVLDRSL